MFFVWLSEAVLVSGLLAFCFSNCLENGSSAQGMFSGICWKKSMFKLGRSDVVLRYLVSSIFVEQFKFLSMVSVGIDTASFYVAVISLCCMM